MFISQRRISCLEQVSTCVSTSFHVHLKSYPLNKSLAKMQSSLLMVLLCYIGAHGYVVFLTRPVTQRRFVASLESDLETLNRKELQQLAKENGVRANMKTTEMIASLQAIKDSNCSPKQSERPAGSIKVKSNEKVECNLPVDHHCDNTDRSFFIPTPFTLS